MYTGEILQAGIGQGFDATTPLQLLNAYCALANAGICGSRPWSSPSRSGRHRDTCDTDPDTQDTGLGADAGDDASRNAGGRYHQHTYNMVDLPIMVAGKTAQPSSHKR